MENNSQGLLFDDLEESWKEEWKGMPEFEQKDLQPMQSIIVHFEKRRDMDSFAKLIGQKLTYKTVSVWYPKAEIDVVKNLRWVSETSKVEKCYWCNLESTVDDKRYIDGELHTIRTCDNCGVNADINFLLKQKAELQNES